MTLHNSLIMLRFSQFLICLYISSFGLHFSVEYSFIFPIAPVDLKNLVDLPSVNDPLS